MIPEGVHEGLEALLVRHRDSLREIFDKELQQVAAQLGRLEDKIADVRPEGKRHMSSDSHVVQSFARGQSELFDYSEQRANKRGREPPATAMRSAASVMKGVVTRMATGTGLLQEGALPAARASLQQELQVRISTASGEELELSTPPVQSPTGLRLCRRSVQRLVRSSPFDAACGMAIMLNAVLIGCDAEYTARNEGDALVEFHTFQYVLSAWYTVELALRIVAEGPKFWCSEDYHWNVLDTLLVSTSVLDFLSAVSPGGVTAGRLLRLLRVARMIRTLRLVRMLHYVRDFRKMLYSLMASGQTLFWSMFLLFGLIYMFAVLFTQDVLQMVANAPQQADKLDHFFGSVAKSIFTLFMSVAGGISWGEVVEPMLEADLPMAFVFVLYLSTIMFGVLNIVTSVFVESAMQGTQHYRDLIIQENIDKKEQSIRHIREIFRQMDTDQGGTITMPEMQAFLRTDDLGLKSYFEALELNASDTQALFKLLDKDRSGAIDIDEFCEGCMRLKGEARSFDINCLMYETRRLQSNMMVHMANMQTVVSELLDSRCRPQGAIDPLREPALSTASSSSAPRSRSVSQGSGTLEPKAWEAEPVAIGCPGHGPGAGADKARAATELMVCPASDKLFMLQEWDECSRTDAMIHC